MSRILVVDDNADNRYSLRLLLDGYDVLEAAGGAEAIALAQRERPHCILLDVQMPAMDGFEVCRRLRADETTRSIPIILVTAHNRDTESVVRGLAAGGDDYVTKPVAHQELLARVRAMLRIRELQERLESLNRGLEDEVGRRTRELRQIYATVPVGIYTLDARGLVTSFNRHISELLGYGEAEVVGRKGIGELFDEGYDPLYWLELCRREGRASGELLARGKDGTLIPVFDERVVTLDHLGERVGFTGYMQDMRHRARMHAIVREQERQAAIGRLAGSIVHEVANPVHGVAQYLEALLKRLDRGETIPAEEMRRGAAVMRDALARTGELIAQLRGVTRATVRREDKVDPITLLGELHALLRHDLHQRGIKMEVKGERGRHTLDADAGGLSQVLLNLITNARDAMPDGGSLLAEVSAQDSTVSIEIRDTGIGIPPEAIGRIFDFLYTTKGEAGTGYGLTISQDIVREHGGRIEVESEVGKGSTFRVLLPRAAAAHGLRESSPGRSGAGSARG